MKAIKKIIKFNLLVAFLLLFTCTDDNEVNFIINNIDAPTNVNATVTITQDNTGTVTITPKAEGAVTFDVDFGDGSELTEKFAAGNSVEHVYVEGNYTASVTAYSIDNQFTSAPIPVVVAFIPPQNLTINAEIDPSNPFQVNVSATADYAASFLVTFDSNDPNEEPTPMGIGETLNFIYPLVGEYTLKVVALSGGSQTSEATEIITIASATELPIDFEIFDASTLIGFGGASAAVVDNPDTNGNSSSKVVQNVKGAPEIWAGTVITTSAPIDFSTKKLIKLDVWSPRPNGNLLVKLENLNDPNIFIEKQVTLTGNSSWEQVEVDFSDIDTAQEYQKIVWFFDFGTVGDGSSDWTFYLDNIKQDFAGVVSSQMIEDFEGTPPTFTVFGNIADTQVISNPDPSGINTSANVAQLTKTSGSEFWAGTFFEASEPLDFENFSQINVKTWSPQAGVVVKLKLENSDASITHEVDLNATVANTWENLLYDFSEAPVADYVRIVIFFDFGNAGDGSLYYFDDVELIGSGGIPPLGFQDFEGAAPAFTVFGNIADTQVISNPDPTGLNVTANVAQLTKTAGSEVWAGTFFEVGTPLDFDSYTQISVKTWSPQSGVVVKLKLENSDASVTHEVDLNATVANAWEELIYDFSEAPAADYVRVVIFFDFGNAGDGSQYYFDEFNLIN